MIATKWDWDGKHGFVRGTRVYTSSYDSVGSSGNGVLAVGCEYLYIFRAFRLEERLALTASAIVTLSTMLFFLLFTRPFLFFFFFARGKINKNVNQSGNAR